MGACRRASQLVPSRHERIHYAWVVASVTFLVLLVAAGVRAVPAVLLLPLETEFGWSLATLSAAVSINLLLYGLIGPFAAGFLERWGLRRTILIALSITALGVLSTAWMTSPWHMTLLWGVVIGGGTGVTALVLAATVVSRWFNERQGLVMGILSSSAAAGQIIFLPVLALLIERDGWRTAIFVAAGAVLLVVPVVLLWMRDDPRDIDRLPFGATDPTERDSRDGVTPRLGPVSILARVWRTRGFLLLAGSFFICGATTVGLVGTHLIPAAHDHGIPETSAAGLLAAMGALNLIGTATSGWLTDRIDGRKLLAWYYGLRGLSLFFLPYAFTSAASALWIFALFYGLDWIATVPPTVKLTREHFGAERTGVVFGWVTAAHQVGAASAALGAGVTRSWAGGYELAFLASGVLCMGAAAMALSITRPGSREAGSHLVSESAPAG